MTEKNEPKIIHEGRAGYVEYEGFTYVIEHIDQGQFCIHFPSGNRHARLQEHLGALQRLADSRDPKWHVENRSKKYK